MLANFIITENPYGLAVPPQWFLDALRAYDPLLVVFPSRCAPVYRTARRTTKGRAALNRALQHYPDSVVYVTHNLWPWKSLEPQVAQLGNSWQKLLTELPEYDQHRFENAGAVADRLDEFDVQGEQATHREIQGELDARNHDAYILAASRMGSRVGLAGKKPGGARRAGQSVYRPLNFGGGSAIFSGR